MAVLRDHIDATLKWKLPDADSVISNYLPEFNDETKRTDAEVAAGVTPVNYAYAPGEVDRYGANAIPGTTDMTAAFNAAFKVAKTSGTDVVYGRSWPYLVTSQIDVTVDTGADNFGFNVVCVGQNHAVTENSPGYPSILADHTGHVFDCTGAPSIDWYNVSVGEATGADAKKTCWLLARNSGESSVHHHFHGCRVRGTFDGAIVYNNGAEETQFDSACVFVNISTAAGSKVFWFTFHNILSYTSSFITMGDATSNICHRIFGGSYYNFNTDNDADVIGIDNCRNFYIYGAFMVNCGRSFIYLDPTNGSSDRIVIHGLEGENSSPLTLYGLYAGAGAHNHAQIVIRDSYIPSQTRAVYAGSGVTISSSTFTNISELSSKGIEIVTKLSQSTIDQFSVVIIGESQQNSITGDSSVFTITTRTNDYWYDTGSTNKTWTPGIGALSIGGGSTVNNVKYGLVGNMFFATFSIFAGTSLTCANNTSITGLPFASAAQSAMVNVTNGTTGASIGNGYTFGTTIKLPAINVTTDVVTVSVWGFLA